VHSILLPRTKYVPYLSAQQLHKKSQGNFYCKPTCPKTFFSKSNAYLWILKPTFMNRGRGVSLFSNLSEFEKLIWKYYEGGGTRGLRGEARNRRHVQIVLGGGNNNEDHHRLTIRQITQQAVERGKKSRSEALIFEEGLIAKGSTKYLIKILKQAPLIKSLITCCRWQ
jgi:hypothetical protein